LVGRVPTYVSALVKKAETGAELTCRAHEKEFVEGGIVVRRRVISHYASVTLAKANDIHAWLSLIEQRSQEDLASGLITHFYQPMLQIVGDHTFRLPGKVKSAQPL
jgi:hypothetical protein